MDLHTSLKHDDVLIKCLTVLIKIIIAYHIHLLIVDDSWEEDKFVIILKDYTMCLKILACVLHDQTPLPVHTTLHLAGPKVI